MSELANVIDLKCRLITSIHAYILEQKDLWLRIPAAAVAANKFGHSNILKQAAEDKLWTINPQGDYQQLLFIRCDEAGAGEVVDENKHAVGSKEMLWLIDCLELLNAKSVLAKLEALAVAPQASKPWHAHDDEREVMKASSQA